LSRRVLENKKASEKADNGDYDFLHDYICLCEENENNANIV
jgi:hypothetical protein